MTPAIVLIVAAYVETRQLDALLDLKAHREALADNVRGRSDFNFGVLLGQLDADIAEIDAGIGRLRALANQTQAITSDPL